MSAQADSPEFVVYVNGKLCKDTDGIPGLCSKRIRSNEDVLLHFDPLPYAWHMTLDCGNVGPFPPIQEVANAAHEILITRAQFVSFKSFTCIGEIFPEDRPQPLSAKWELRAKIVDAQYEAREQITEETKDGRTYLVLGQFARSAWVFDEGKWSKHWKDTIVEIKGNPHHVQAWSESYQMRVNTFQLEAPVSPTVSALVEH